MRVMSGYLSSFLGRDFLEQNLPDISHTHRTLAIDGPKEKLHQPHGGHQVFLVGSRILRPRCLNFR
eukprot:7186016-Prorocentrum_lima.AAC.1